MNIDGKHHVAGYPPAPLEDWYRHHYFANEIDISGSGVEDYTFQDIQRIAGFSFGELDASQLHDAPTVGGVAIRTRLASLFGTGDPDSVMVTNGANEGLQLVVRSVLKPGDELITLGPCYHCHDKIAESMGVTVRKWALSVDGDFQLDVGALASLVSADTKALCLNFPHNPTGKSISQEMLDDIVAIARDNDLYLIWDAVFQQLTYEQPPLQDPIHRYAKTITLGTFSKAYGAPGLRFGWIIGPHDVIAASVRQKDYGNLFVAPLIEFAAEKMLARLEAFSLPRLAQATANRMAVDEWLGRDDIALAWRRPDGGVCGLVALPAGAKDVEFCSGLLAKEGVLLVPGSCFGMPGHARLGFGGNGQKLVEGLARLERFLGLHDG